MLPRLHVWSYLVRRNLVVASGAAHVDTFLVLSGLGHNGELDAIKEALKPVSAIGSATSDCSSPLLAPLCAARGYLGAPPRARVQFFWVEQCLDAVAAHEATAAVAYDWTLRVRPDGYFFGRMPPLSALDAHHVYHTIKMDEASDMFYAIPRALRERFARGVGAATTPPGVRPELAVPRYMSSIGVAMRPMALPVGLMRPCVLECFFFPRRLDGVLQPSSPFDERDQLRPAPTEWELTCQKAAEHLGAYSWTPRIAKLLGVWGHAAPLLPPCYKWNDERGYRAVCCAVEMARACVAIAPAARELVGWGGCARHGPDAAAALHGNRSVVELKPPAQLRAQG